MIYCLKVERVGENTNKVTFMRGDIGRVDYGEIDDETARLVEIARQAGRQEKKDEILEVLGML